MSIASRYLRAAVMVLVSLSTAIATAQDTQNFPVLGEIVRLDPRLDALVPRDSKIEVLGVGFEWAEGPVWVSRDGGYLLFSDIPRNSIMRWTPGKGVSLFLKPAGFTGLADYGGERGTNGLAIDAAGNLICCEHGDRRVSVMTWDGGKRTLADMYDGRRLNSPNDLVFHSNGDLYFTDPPYGLPDRWDDPRRELDFCGVYRVSPDRELTLLTKEMTRPNGIGFSTDEKTLYVAQSDPAAALWRAFDVQKDGTLGEIRVLYDATDMVGRSVRVRPRRDPFGTHRHEGSDRQLLFRRPGRQHALPRRRHVDLQGRNNDPRRGIGQRVELSHSP